MTEFGLHGVPGKDSFAWLFQVKMSVEDLEEFLKSQLNLEMSLWGCRYQLGNNDVLLPMLRLLFNPTPSAAVVGLYKPRLTTSAFHDRYGLLHRLLTCRRCLSHCAATRHRICMACDHTGADYPQTHVKATTVFCDEPVDNSLLSVCGGKLNGAPMTQCLLLQWQCLTHALAAAADCDAFVRRHLFCCETHCYGAKAAERVACTNMHQRWRQQWCFESVGLRCALCLQEDNELIEVDPSTAIICANLGKSRRRQLAVLRCCEGTVWHCCWQCGGLSAHSHTHNCVSTSLLPCLRESCQRRQGEGGCG